MQNRKKWKKNREAAEKGKKETRKGDENRKLNITRKTRKEILK